MTFSDLTAALARLSSDPRVDSNTPVEIEFDYDTQHYDSNVAHIETEHIKEYASACCVAVVAENGRRCVAISALPRPDALVR